MDFAGMDNWRTKDVARLLSLVEAERRYFQEMVSALPAPTAVVARDLTLAAANRAFRRRFGLGFVAEETRPIEELVPVEGLRAALEAALAEGGARAWLAENVATAGGERTLRISVAPHRDWDEAAEPQALLVIEDITEAVAGVRGDAKAALAALQQRLDALPAVAWRLDPATMRFTEVSQEAAVRLGLPAEYWRVDAEFWSGRVHSDDLVRLRGLYQVALGGGPLASYDYRAPAGEGRARWLRDLVRLERDQEGNVTLVEGVTVDVTASRCLSESHHQARKADALTRLAARLVHEGNNLLTILSGFGEDLLHGMPPEHPLRANVQEILHAGDRLSALFAQLRPSTARPAPQLRVFPVDEFLAGLRDSLRPELPAGVGIELDLAAPAAAIEADPERLAELIGTLVRRACDNLAKGGTITFSTRLEEVADAGAPGESPLAPGPVVAIGVHHNGLAIHPGALARVFEPAETPEEARTNLASLYLSVLDNGGDMDVSSGYRQGTRFIIRFPRVAAAEIEAGAAPAPEPQAPAPAPSEVVLVVEDEPGIRTLIRKTLHRSGYAVLEAGDGQQALELARSHEGPIHLLLTDVVMPQMGGVELAESAIPLRPGMKVLFISGYTGPAGVETTRLAAAAAFLQKPFTLAALMSKVKELLASRDASRASV